MSGPFNAISSGRMFNSWWFDLDIFNKVGVYFAGKCLPAEAFVEMAFNPLGRANVKTNSLKSIYYFECLF